MTEDCSNCVYLMRLYVPPINTYKDVPKDAYVCGLFASEGEVLYKSINHGMCECFTSKEEK